MALRFKRGLGAVDIFGQRCTPGGGELGALKLADWSCPAPQWWIKTFGLTDTGTAVAPAPTGSVLTVPPASGEEAQATVDALLNQQLVAQQAADAEGVRSGAFDQVASAVVDTANTAVPWMWIGLAGLGLFAVVAIGGGSPRRYGR